MGDEGDTSNFKGGQTQTRAVTAVGPLKKNSSSGAILMVQKGNPWMGKQTQRALERVFQTQKE